MAKKDPTPEKSEEPKVEPKVETPPTVPPAQQDEDYEARFKGLQRSFDKRQKDYLNLQEKHDALQEEAETSKQSDREKQAKLDALQKEADEAKAELDKTAGELATQEAKVNRANMIMSQFPELAPFEAEGLLPETGTEEEMTEKFTAFSEALNKRVQTNVERQVVGSAAGDTGPPPRTPVRDEAYIYNRLQQLAGTRDPKLRDEYIQLMAEWDEIQAQKAK